MFLSPSLALFSSSNVSQSHFPSLRCFSAGRDWNAGLLELCAPNPRDITSHHSCRLSHRSLHSTEALRSHVPPNVPMHAESISWPSLIKMHEGLDCIPLTVSPLCMTNTASVNNYGQRTALGVWREQENYLFETAIIFIAHIEDLNKHEVYLELCCLQETLGPWCLLWCLFIGLSWILHTKTLKKTELQSIKATPWQPFTTAYHCCIKFFCSDSWHLAK